MAQLARQKQLDYSIALYKEIKDTVVIPPILSSIAAAFIHNIIFRDCVNYPRSNGVARGLLVTEKEAIFTECMEAYRMDETITKQAGVVYIGPYYCLLNEMVKQWEHVDDAQHPSTIVCGESDPEIKRMTSILSLLVLLRDKAVNNPCLLPLVHFNSLNNTQLNEMDKIYAKRKDLHTYLQNLKKDADEHLRIKRLKRTENGEMSRPIKIYFASAMTYKDQMDGQVNAFSNHLWLLNVYSWWNNIATDTECATKVQKDSLAAIKECDCVVATFSNVVGKDYPFTGTMSEIATANALNKPVFAFVHRGDIVTDTASIKNKNISSRTLAFYKEHYGQFTQNLPFWDENVTFCSTKDDVIKGCKELIRKLKD